MRTRPIRLAALVLAALAAVSVRAQTQHLPTIGVLDFTGTGASEAELTTLSDRLRIELVNTGQFTVLERAQMNTILQEQGFQQSACTATECAVEVGQLLGAEKMVAGSIGRVGQTYQVSLRLIDVATGAIEHTALKDCRCTLEELLTTTIAQAAAELAGVAPVVTTPLQRGEGFGILYVASTPPGAQVILNGRLTEKVTPATIERLPAGEHVVRLTKGDLIAEQRVTVIRDDVVRLTLELRPGMASLYINSTPPDAEVTLDGQPAGVTPLIVRDVTVGAHTIRLVKTDYLPWESQVALRFSERAEVLATLEPCGYLAIRTEPADAAVFVDGRSATAKGLVRLMLPIGEHQVVVTCADYDSLAQNVSIAQGQISTVQGTLRYHFGSVRVTSTPSGATVTSTPAGISGTTPLSLSRVEPCSYAVRLNMADRMPYERSISVAAGKMSTVEGALSYTPEYLARAERQRQAELERQRLVAAERQRIAAAHRAQMKAGFRWISLGVAVVAAGIGYRFNRDVASAIKERRAAYDDYLKAITTQDAVARRKVFEDATNRVHGAALRRNVFYGVAGAGLGVGIVLSIP